MSLLYRIADTRYAKDLTGEGARLNGGRWSPPGVRILHTSESVALSCMEVMVHAGSRRLLAKAQLSLVTYERTDNSSIMEIDISTLVPNWRDSIAPNELQDIGETWTIGANSLALRVPSVPVPWGRERNILINPQHSEFDTSFKILKIEPFFLDNRLTRKDKDSS